MAASVPGNTPIPSNFQNSQEFPFLIFSSPKTPFPSDHLHSSLDRTESIVRPHNGTEISSVLPYCGQGRREKTEWNWWGKWRPILEGLILKEMKHNYKVWSRGVTQSYWLFRKNLSEDSFLKKLSGIMPFYRETSYDVSQVKNYGKNLAGLVML